MSCYIQKKSSLNETGAYNFFYDMKTTLFININSYLPIPLVVVLDPLHSNI